MSDDEISIQFATYAEKKLDWPRRDSIVRRSVNAFVAIGYALLGIHVELRRLNEGRDQFHREVLDVLTQAKGQGVCGDISGGGRRCLLEPDHEDHHSDCNGTTWWTEDGSLRSGQPAAAPDGQEGGEGD